MAVDFVKLANDTAELAERLYRLAPTVTNINPFVESWARIIRTSLDTANDFCDLIERSPKT